MRQRAQHGFVLIALIALLVMGALAFLVSNLSPEFMQAYRQRQTDAALMQAREALIGYALQYREQQAATDPAAMYGYLPLPDLGESVNLNGNLLNQPCTSEGCAKINAAGVSGSAVIVGRFPWKTVGTSPLRDGNGECLWYAVAATHRAVNSTSTMMNWDTLAVPDIVIGSGSATLAAINEHDRPIAVIFSADPSFDSGRTTSSDAPECHGNYDVTHYINPALNNAQRALTVTSSMLFGTLWKSSVKKSNDPPSRPPSFRDDINDMLDQVTNCAQDQIASGSITGNAKVTDACSLALDAYGPRGYYSSYRDQIFVAKCVACQVTVDNNPASSCAGAVLFGNQRSSGQNRRNVTEIGDFRNYLEGDNLTSFNSNGNVYAGSSNTKSDPTLLPIQPLGQDILRCIPAGASLTSVESTTLTSLGFGQLSSYDAASRTLTLGSLNLTTGAVGAANAAALFGCDWQPTHATGSGLRSYFLFNITNTGFPGPGFTFAAVDGDRNTAGVCGAAGQHLGYSGNNGSTPLIAAPKIGVEFDTRRNFRSRPPFLPNGFDPSRTSGATQFRTLDNGRADPSYTGGHIAVVYWGSNAPISTGYACTVTADCRSPSICDAGVCKLPAEEDDNVHGQLPSPPAVRPPPGNPVPPINPPPSPPPYPPPGVTKLDPSLSGTPTNQNIHVRVEIERTYAGRDDNSRLVKFVASSPITLSGLQTIDSVAVLADDTVLVTAQADARTNGVYLASTGAWTRDASADESIDLPPGTAWFIKTGTVNAGSLWRLQNSSTPALNIDTLSIQRVRLPVKAVATSSVTLAGLTVDGVALVAGDRVLVAAQATASQNGVYLASGGAWTRATPENVAAGMKDGSMWFVSAGSRAGQYWRLNGDATPGASNPISIAQVTPNDLYSATVQTQVWMLKDSVTTANQIARMKRTARAMAQLDPVVRYGQCSSGVCAAGQSCGGLETDGNRYCYTGQQPNLHDRKKFYDEQGNACSSGAACSDGEFCGIDSGSGNLCYKPALRTLRLGFTNSQDNRDQIITISNSFTTWLP